jgi:hypothetical protein
VERGPDAVVEFLKKWPGLVESWRKELLVLGGGKKVRRKERKERFDTGYKKES